MNLPQAKTMTVPEKRWMGIPPLIVSGQCPKCFRLITVRVYGLREELQQIQLVCWECDDEK